MITLRILDNVVDHLLDEEGGLSGSGTGVNENNPGICQNSIFLLLVQPLEAIRLIYPEKLECCAVRENFRRIVDYKYEILIYLSS